MSQLNAILAQIGEFGAFQIRLYLFLNILTIFKSCQLFLLVFVADKPQWSCPIDEGLLDKRDTNFPCMRNGSLCESVQFTGEFTSIASEWRLLCDQEYKRGLASAVMMAGMLLGAVMFGSLADKRGRRFTIISMYPLVSLMCFASGFAQSYGQFVLLRFLTAVLFNGSSTAVFVLISETVGQKSKDTLLTAHSAFYAMGYVVLSLFAYCIREWRYLTIVLSLPLVFSSMFFLQNIVCESPLWLVENGQIEEAKLLLTQMAKENGKELSEKSLEKLSNDVPKVNLKSSQSDSGIFAKPEYLKKVIILSVIWLCLAMMYYGLSMVSGSLSSNKYLSFSLSGLVEIPALMSSVWLIKSGRRIPLFALALVGALACLVCALLQSFEQSYVGALVTVLALLGKFGIAASYNIIYIFSAEQFGVAVRSFSMAIFSTASSIGGILAPLVISLEIFDKRIPLATFGISAVCAAMLVMTLSETLKVAKPDRKTK